MARNSMAIVIGVTVAFFIKWTYVSIDNRLFPLPEGINIADAEVINTYFRNLPVSSFILTLFFNALMTLGAAYAAVKVAATQHRNIALGIGLFLLIMGLIRMFTMPHPVWFILIDLCLYIPMAGLGHRLSMRD